jgi:Ca-activated chloride channel family protein
MFTIDYPWLFLLLPLPLVVKYFLPSADHSENALKVPFFDAITSIADQTKKSYLTSNATKILALVIWGLIVCAATSPQWFGKAIALPQNGRDIMLAVDISGSMQLQDMSLNGQKADRLAVVKTVGEEFINSRKGDRLGLILFGSRAYLQTPLTFDTKTVQHMLNDATIGLAGLQTAIGDAIGLATKRLLDISQENRVLILLTDGGNNSGTASPLSAAKLAAENNIRIYTIGFGADQMTVPTMFGHQKINPSTELDEKTLKEIAETTQGRYFRAKDTEGLQQVYHFINTLEPVNHEEQLYRPSEALYPYPLALGIILSLLAALHIVLKNLLFNFKTQTGRLRENN